MSNRRRKYHHRRRGGFGFLYKLLTMLVICAAIVAALTLFFKVNTIAVSGQIRYTNDEILDASGVKSGDNLFLLNKYDVANQLLEKLPYIETVRINRKLPDTLLIDVTECQQVFAVRMGSTAWLISPGGKIVENCKTSEVPENTPVIDGCELLAPSVGSKIALSSEHRSQEESLLALLSALQDAGLSDQVTAVHLGSAAELTMDYAQRFTVKLPYGADYAYKLRNLTAVVDALETNQTGSVDLTKDGEAHFLPE